MALRRYQYPGLTAPVLPTPDAIIPPAADSLFSSAVVNFTRTVLYATWAFCPFTPPATETLTPDKWLPQVQAPAKAPAPRQVGWFAIDPIALTAPETTSADRWTGYEPDSIATKRAAPHLYPSSFFDPYPRVATETVTIDKWNGELPDWIFTRPRGQNPGQFTIDPYWLTRPESVSADRWAGEWPDRIFDRPRLQYLLPSAFLDPRPIVNTEVITIDKWLGRLVDRVFFAPHRGYQFPAFVIDPRALTAPETTSEDRWAGYRPDRIFDRQRLQFQAPSMFGDLRPIVPLVHPLYPAYVPRRAPLPTLPAKIDPLKIELITLDKWEYISPTQVRGYRYDPHQQTAEPVAIVITLASTSAPYGNIRQPENEPGRPVQGYRVSPGGGVIPVRVRFRRPR